MSLLEIFYTYLATYLYAHKYVCIYVHMCMYISLYKYTYLYTWYLIFMFNLFFSLGNTKLHNFIRCFSFEKYCVLFMFGWRIKFFIFFFLIYVQEHEWNVTVLIATFQILRKYVLWQPRWKTTSWGASNTAWPDGQKKWSSLCIQYWCGLTCSASAGPHSLKRMWRSLKVQRKSTKLVKGLETMSCEN